MCLVSIIVPVFNGASYIGKGVQSIINQTYTKIEIIIVDDGSTDDSKIIISDLIKDNKDSEMEFIYCYQDNAGISSARNKGLDIASGKYVIFMDQDDWLEEDYVKTLVERIEETEEDLVISGFKLVDLNGDIIEKWRLDEKYEWSKFRITAPWGRIFRKQVIDENQLRFMNTKISEDLYFNIMFFSYTPKIKVTSYIGYNWLYNLKSESRAKWNVISKDRNPFIMLNELHNKMKQPNDMCNTMLTYFFTKYIIWYFFYSVRSSNADLFKNIYKEGIKWLDNNYSNWSGGGIAWRNPGGEKQKTHIIIIACIWLYKMRLLRVLLYLYKKYIL